MRTPLHSAVVLAVATIAVAAPLAVTASDASNQPATALQQSAVDLHGLDDVTVAWMWSRDTENTSPGNAGVPLYTELQDDGRFDELLEAATTTDRVQATPPEHAQTWTAGEFSELDSRSYTSRSSVRPQGADTSDGQFIKDAHATTFGVLPSTIVVEGDAPQRYISRNGEMLALLDYRVTTPDDRTVNPPNDNIIERTTEWDVESDSIKHIEFVVDGTVVETRNGSGVTHTPRFAYDSELVDTETSSLTIRATYNVTVNKTVTTTKRVRVDDDDEETTDAATAADQSARTAASDGLQTRAVTPARALDDPQSNPPLTPDPGPGGPGGPDPEPPVFPPPAPPEPDPEPEPEPNPTPEPDPDPGDSTPVPDDEPEYREVTTTTTTTKTETVTVTTTVDVAVNDLSSAVEGHYADYENRDVGGYALEASTHRWAGFRIGDTLVDNAWGFLTGRNPLWDQFVVTTEQSSSVTVSPAVPAEVFAVPVDESVTANGSTESEVVDTWGTTRESPSVPSTFDVAAPAGQYTAPTGAAAVIERTDSGQVGSTVGFVSRGRESRRAIEVYGLVHGKTATLEPWQLSNREVRESELSLTVDRTTDEQVFLQVALTEAESGAPISLSAGRTPRIQPVQGDDGSVTQSGVIVVENRRTGETRQLRPEDGTAVVAFESRGLYSARFEPVSWVVATPTYQPATSGTKQLDFGMQAMLDWLVILLMSFGPFVALYWALGGMEGIWNGGLGSP